MQLLPQPHDLFLILYLLLPHHILYVPHLLDSHVLRRHHPTIRLTQLHLIISLHFLQLTNHFIYF